MLIGSKNLEIYSNVVPTVHNFVLLPPNEPILGNDNTSPICSPSFIATILTVHRSPHPLMVPFSPLLLCSNSTFNTVSSTPHTAQEPADSPLPPFLAFQSRSLSGSFYLIDDLVHKVYIVNWTLGQTTGSYHTTARTLTDIIHEWAPLYPYFTHIRTTSLGPDISDTIPVHEPILFTLQVPRTFHLRLLTLVASHATIMFVWLPVLLWTTCLVLSARSLSRLNNRHFFLI